MANVRIFTDSISDIPKEWEEKYDIGIIPLYIVFQQDSYLDRIEITPQEMYNMVELYEEPAQNGGSSTRRFYEGFQPGH